MTPRRRMAAPAVLLLLLLVACGPLNGRPTPPPASGSTPLTPLTVGLGYIPSVQFAQFYLAQQAGYYRDAGLQVTFQNKIDPDLGLLVGRAATDAGTSHGTTIRPPLSHGTPARTV